MIKLITIDIDGTLLTNLRRLPKKNKEMIVQINADDFVNILRDDDLINYIIDNKNCLNDFDENNKKIQKKNILKFLFNNYLNNLLNYDDDFYKTFKIDKILNFDSNILNKSILTNFFEDDAQNQNISLKNDLRKNFFSLEIITTNINLPELEIILSNSQNKKTIRKTINIIFYYLIIDDINNILNNNKEMYSFLTPRINAMKKHLEALIKIVYQVEKKQITSIMNYRLNTPMYGIKKLSYFVEEFQKRYNNTKINNDSMSSKIGEINEEIIKISKCLNNVLNNTKKAKYLLYSTYFRSLLGIDEIF